jgi:hypothetical protein
MMDDWLACETRLADHDRKTMHVDAEGWKKPLAAPYRIVLAKALLAWAMRLAPMVMLPNPTTRAVAQ